MTEPTQCSATKDSEEFPAVFQCQLDEGHAGAHTFVSDTDFAVLSMVYGDDVRVVSDDDR